RCWDPRCKLVETGTQRVIRIVDVIQPPALSRGIGITKILLPRSLFVNNLDGWGRRSPIRGGAPKA
ncbi:hypothetical protein A2U01_0106515, partial [Trifolium medium]|nr:hypothetical protein [Trifolium medium]